MQTLSPAVKDVAVIPGPHLIVKNTYSFRITSSGFGIRDSKVRGGETNLVDRAENFVDFTDGGFCWEIDRSIEVRDLSRRSALTSRCE